MHKVTIHLYILYCYTFSFNVLSTFPYITIHTKNMHTLFLSLTHTQYTYTRILNRKVCAVFIAAMQTKQFL